MVSLGGYLELELDRHAEYHPQAIRLNTAHNAFRLLLETRPVKRVFMPWYQCHVMVKPLDELGIACEPYEINAHLEVPSLPTLAADEIVVAVNYFGLKSTYLKELSKKVPALVVDNSQAFFAEQLPVSGTLYSARKFFGVPDGAYLYAQTPIDTSTLSPENAPYEHLLMRISAGAEAGYDAYQAAEAYLESASPASMSQLARRILQSVDYHQVAKMRRNNFRQLQESLGHLNELELSLLPNDVPLAYPLLSHDPDLRQHLIEDQLYIPQYWPSVLQTAPENSWSYRLAQNLLPLPIDQRYDQTAMAHIINLIHKHGNDRP